MRLSRGLRTLARVGLGIVLVTPVLALPLAIWFDRGPSGETRFVPHFFPLALWIFDDFAWTCARNSLIFATVASLTSLVVGAALGWTMARRQFWGRGILRGMVLALLAVAPAFLALGLLGSAGTPRPWPWPLATNGSTAIGVSLEAWTGLPLWIAWIWTTLPWGVALVALVTSATVEQLEPSWMEAARLTGVGSLRAWRGLLWPLVRPASARAAGLVFVFALAEPGAPLVLGLRRTLAFQLVQAAGKLEDFPAAAVWALMTGLFGLIGWTVWRSAGGAPILEYHGHETPRTRTRRPLTTSRVWSLAAAALLACWALIGWLPLLGLGRLLIAGTTSTGGGWRAIEEHARRLAQPPIPGVVASSAILGLEVAAATVVVAWLVGSRSRAGHHSRIGTRLVRLIGCAPPLLQAAGLMAISWLAGLWSTALADRAGWGRIASGMGSAGAWLDPYRNPWTALSCGVALAIVPRFSRYWHRDAVTARTTVSAHQAALLAGASHLRAGRLSLDLPRGRWLAGGLLVWALAATNLTPALLFEPWSDVLTIGPAVVRLAAGAREEQSRAAALAVCAIVINMVTLGIARASDALPRSVDLD